MSGLNDNLIMQIVRESLWTSGNIEVHASNGNGELTAGITDRTKREHVINVYNWKELFRDIINEIIRFSKDNTFAESEFKQKIDNVVHKMETVDQEIIVNTIDSSYTPGSRAILSTKTVILKKGTILYRYTDDKDNHLYANPHPVAYGRFTDPNSIINHSVIYLAYKKEVAKKEVAKKEVEGSNSTQLVRYRLRKDIKLKITPGMLPSASKADLFFTERLRKFNNLVLTLKSTNAYFDHVENKDRVSKGIYITTNTVLEYLQNSDDVGIVYPSTKVGQNSTLGRMDNNENFIPNKENADIAIFNDLERKNGEWFSKYLEALI